MPCKFNLLWGLGKKKNKKKIPTCFLFLDNNFSSLSYSVFGVFHPLNCSFKLQDKFVSSPHKIAAWDLRINLFFLVIPLFSEARCYVSYWLLPPSLSHSLLDIYFCIIYFIRSWKLKFEQWICFDQDVSVRNNQRIVYSSNKWASMNIAYFFKNLNLMIEGIYTRITFYLLQVLQTL